MITGNLLKTLAQLIHFIIQAYILIIIVRSVISWIGTVPRNQFTFILRKLTDPVFRFVHKRLPFTIIGGIDISPIFIVIALYFIDNFLYSVLMGYAAQLLHKSPGSEVYGPFSLLGNSVVDFISHAKTGTILSVFLKGG